MNTPPLTAKRLLELAEPFLAERNDDGLAAALRPDWHPNRLIELLEVGSDAVSQVAAIGLGLIGGMPAAESLCRALYHRDAQVVRAAENALWNIWFRAGGLDAQDALYQAIQPIEIDQYAEAIRRLGLVIRNYPRFAEAYNQRGLAHFMADGYVAALTDYTRTIRMNPRHFSAMAGAGHCLAAMRRFDEAIRTYKAVLQIHPRLEGIRQAIRSIKDAHPGGFDRPALDRGPTPDSQWAIGRTRYSEDSADAAGSIVRK
jgi:tetratricopeptide (TPR) repeat protein